MIEEFSFGNFTSFKDVQTLRMTASKIKSKNKINYSNIFEINEKLSLLKSKAIYGANASGKSNIVSAINCFINIVNFSVKDNLILNLINSFQLSTETENAPSFFQLIFRIDGIRYRYGFEADDKNIKSEWLFCTPNKREQPLFIREGNKLIDLNNTHFEEGILYEKLFKNSDAPIFTNTSLFLTHLSNTGFGKISKLVLKSISSINIINGLGHKDMYGIAGDSLNEISKKNFILNFLKNGDTGINNLEVEELENENDKKIFKHIISHKTKFNEDLKPNGISEFSFAFQESEGTKKMFEISPFIYNSLKNGNVLIIDEFDARLHSLLTKKIVKIYNSIENKNAQLIFTTHDTNLLNPEILRRDQIDFVEKDKYGASHLYTLIEINGIRNESNYEKDYIQGKYGAIPYLGELNLLNFE
jgi:AAA15 family ATPase/GTPase